MNDKEYMKMAYKVAIDLSTDPSTQNGAILVNPDGDAVARGANHFPHGVKESDERWERPAKYSFVEHAERNAIFDAAKRGISTDGLIMYCPWFACADCGRAIIQAGIKEVIGHNLERPSSPTWDETIKKALDMFNESGVKYRYYTGNVEENIIINGKVTRV